MTVAEMQERWPDCEIMVFSQPSYDGCIVGVTTSERAVYSYSKMVDWLMEKEGMSAEDAEDFIGYNTIRSLCYAGDGAPLVLDDIEWF